MRIGIVQGFVGGGGGTEKTLMSIIDALVEKKFSVTLYTFSKPTINIPGIKISSIIPIKLPFFGLYQRTMESRIIKRASSDDIVIEASGGFVISPNNNQKILVYCHGDFSNELEKSRTKYTGIWSNYYKIYYELIKKNLQFIKQDNVFLIANSNYIKKSLQEKYDKSSTIIYPPLDLSEFNSTLIKNNSIVTISRYSSEKNLEFAIDTVKHIPIKYNIIGNTKTKSNIAYYDKLNSKIKSINSSQISLLKNISRKSLIDYLLTSKIYFHTSQETFGLSVVESIAAGCIPIVPDNSAHKETVPFSELRYRENDSVDARNKLQHAINGDFDHFKEPLKLTISKYDKQQFKSSLVNYIQNIL